MVKVGVIGLGKWGKNHLRVYSELDCVLVGVADVDHSTSYLTEDKNIHFFADYKQLLPLVDAVSVVVPTDLHYQVVRDCLEANKHVLVEKPITLDSEKAKELVDLAERKGLILSVGYLYRFNAAVKKLKGVIKSVGKIQYITGRYVHSTKPPRKDSGAIFNLSIHLIDVLNFILEGRPKKVYCKKINHLSERFEDSAVMVLDYGDFLANLEMSCCHPLKRRDMWIIGSKEKVYVDFLEQILVRHPLEVSSSEIKGGRRIKVDVNKCEPLNEELKHFCQVVRAKSDKTNNGHLYTEVMNIGKEEYYTTKICELAVLSAKFNRDLDLEENGRSTNM